MLNQHVRMQGRPDIYSPLHMIADCAGTQVILTLLRQAAMDDAAFEADAQAVMEDLRRLKALLEDKTDG
jgi:hypothetical protein